MLPQCTSDTKLQKGTFQHTALYKNCKQGAHTPTHWHTTPPQINSITTTHQQRVQYRGVWYDSCRFSPKKTQSKEPTTIPGHISTALLDAFSAASPCLRALWCEQLYRWSQGSTWRHSRGALWLRLKGSRSWQWLTGIIRGSLGE